VKRLPFEDEYFDLVASCASLHGYKQSSPGDRHVLRSGGDLWLTLHPASMVFSRAKRSAWGGNLKDIVLCSYVLLNGKLFNSFGMQISFRGRQEPSRRSAGS
jgi:hypothetical protein